jgi:predicted SAM-dependent methyltransferase
MDDFKLDLACGSSKKEGFYGVDVSDKVGADLVFNLMTFPWPWSDSSVDEIHCSHFIEHLPMIEIDGKDMLFRFFDECYRILKPEGLMTIVTPNARCNRAFQDPTHRRFIVAETFLYLAKEWRVLNKLDHYNVDCDFATTVDPIVMSEMTLLHPEAQNRRFNGEWNTILDWQAKMVSKKETSKMNIEEIKNDGVER